MTLLEIFWIAAHLAGPVLLLVGLPVLIIIEKSSD